MAAESLDFLCKYQNDGCQDIFSHQMRVNHEQSKLHEVQNGTRTLTVFNCLGHRFCLHFGAFPLGAAPVYISFLRFMGSEEDAQKFSYRLQVNGNGKKLTREGIPRSIQDSHRKVRDSLDGLIIQRNLALASSSSGVDTLEGEELNLRLSGVYGEMECPNVNQEKILVSV